MKTNHIYKLKQYCWLFPGDFEFERNTLIQLWVGMGFSSQTYNDAEVFCNTCFDILLKDQLIIFSRVDILTGISMYKVDRAKLNAIEDQKHYTWLEDDKFWHVFLASQNINNNTFKELMSFGSNLRTLMFPHNYNNNYCSFVDKLSSDIFLTLDSIHTLDLSGTSIKELPRSIGNATQLRFLDLSFTLIDSLPAESIGRLTQLQTLKLEKCKNLFELPTTTKDLIQLRYLYFDVLGKSFLPKGIGALTELRLLSAFLIMDPEEGYNVGELKALNNLGGRFTLSGLENLHFADIDEARLEDKNHITCLELRWNKLQSYSLDDKYNAYSVVANLKLSTCLEELHLRYYPGLELPSWINLRNHAKLVSITLLNSENIDLTISLGSLPNLKYLTILYMDKVSKIDNRFRGSCEACVASFPKLEKLKIYGMFGLETWTDVFVNDFQLLSELIIRHCPKLIQLPFLSQLQPLKYLEISNCSMFERLPDGKLSTSLEHLEIYNCPILENRCSRDGEDWHKIQHVPNISIDLEDIGSSYKDDDED